MQSETPEHDARHARETAIYRMLAGAGIVLALAFGLLNLSGVIHI